jgi:hypothetical protein
MHHKSVSPVEELIPRAREAHARLLFGSHETFPIICIGKPALAIEFVKNREITGRSMDQISIKTPNPKYRLFLKIDM